MDSRFAAWDRPRVYAADDLEDEERQPFTVRDRIREVARDRLLQKVQHQEENKIRGVKEHPHYQQANRMRWYNRLTCTSAMISLILGIWQNELHWQSTKQIEPDSPEMGPIQIPTHDPNTRVLLKWIVSANVLVVVAGIYLYYRAMLRLEKLRGTMLAQDTFYSAGYLPYWLLESLICSIHPFPFLYFEFTKPERGGLKTIYTSDDMLTVMMIPRLYLVFRVFRDFYALNHENKRHWGLFGGVDLERPLVLFKNMLLDHPLFIVPTCYILNIFCLGYAMCVFERPTDVSFLKYKNGIWVTFVSMTTVGYGDLYPTTDFGRLISVTTCMLALLILMLCLIGLDAYMTPDPKELTAFHLIKHKDWRRDLRAKAVVVIQQFWRSIRLLNNQVSFSSTYLSDTRLSTLIRAFRDHRRCQPLPHEDIGLMSWSAYNLTRTTLDRIVTLEKRILANEEVNRQFQKQASGKAI